MNPLYEIRDLGVDLGSGAGLVERMLRGALSSVSILKNISLEIAAGETLGLVGESGSGKTTLARAMLGLVPKSAGTLCFESEMLESRASFSRLRRASAMMFQDSVASLSPRLKVGALVTEPLVIHGMAMDNRKAMAIELLARVGLPAALAERYPHELSGGQARRVSVARALALNPKLVIADEPTAGLDVSVQGEILNLMTGLKREMGLSFLIITHNLAVVRHVSDRMAILYLGRITEVGPTREVFAAPRHPYTQSLIASGPQPDPRKRRKDLAIKGEIPSVLARPRGCAFHTRCRHAKALCAEQEPSLRPVGAAHFAACHFAESLEQPNQNQGGYHETELAH